MINIISLILYLLLNLGLVYFIFTNYSEGPCHEIPSFYKGLAKEQKTSFTR
jgi:hypothetical protein